ncbi:hypothetical protein [Polyangium jinanense]|uniref:Lipoprotein n=1 Tax=Polyangium jinanense TaxID=2829994 RepID=A0A9X4AYA4_9BACT|nr:hypothetical protein [Polyangium jinanense]MDC3960315.1 hypothetical protein [Polyangium jinanense]MDC3989498.1 hypothetical protein [Polyangium jinanense]
MTRFPHAFLRSLRASGPSLVLCAALFAGCSEESDDTTTETTKTDPPTISLKSPAEGACVSIGETPDVRIPFVLEVKALFLRPPGSCGDTEACGHLELSANGKVVNRGSGTVVDFPMIGVADRYDTFNVEIVVVDDEGEPLQGGEGSVLRVTRTITTAPSCDTGGGA